MSESHSIFQFNDPVEYLNYELESKRRRNNRFSLRAWSKQLGYENPAFVSHILKSRRTLKMTVATKFSRNLKLTGKVKKYFELLVLLRNSKSADEKNFYIDALKSFRPGNIAPSQSLNLEAFRVISDWYHLAILELVEIKDFANDVEWIRSRLGFDVSAQNIKDAIQRLLKLELLELTRADELRRVKDSPILLHSLVPNEAIRHFHRQMIEKAKAAIDDQPVSARDIRGSMISLRAKDYLKAQEIIEAAHAQIVKLSCRGNGEELYQFNTQFFKITKAKKESV